MDSQGIFLLFLCFGILISICIFEQGPANSWHKLYVQRHQDKLRGLLVQSLMMCSWVGVAFQLICWILAWLAPPMSNWKQARHLRLYPPMPAHDEVRAEDFPFHK
ncbi:MAG TPA: hypothetical protein VGE30_00455 [Candidatus Saccharimonadales bacterium]